MSLLGQTPQQIQAYQQGVIDDNYRFLHYRTIGGRLPTPGQTPNVAQLYPTPRARTADLQPPVWITIARGATGVNTQIMGRPRPSNPNAQVRAARAQVLASTRAYFERAPRYLYRRVLGRGGQGTAFKMTYRSPATNDEANFVLKTAGASQVHEAIRHEARMMEKVKRSAHCVQILHSSGKFRSFDNPNPWDSSDDPDEDSSGDEEDPNYQPRPPRPAMNQGQRIWAHNQRQNRVSLHWKARGRRVARIVNAAAAGRPRPNEDPIYTDAIVQPERHDFIFMEYMELGTLEQVLYRFADNNNNNDLMIPNAVLWSFWLCNRFRQAGEKRPGMEQSRKAIDLRAPFDPDMLLLEEMPPAYRRGKRKRMVHFDIDPSNMFLGPALHPYQKNNPAYNSNAVVNNQIPRPIDIRMEDGFPVPDDALEHDQIPILKLGDFGLTRFIKPGKRNQYYRQERENGKWSWYTPEQFCPDWDFVPLTRDGTEISQELVAGNFDWHSNVWQMGLVSPTIFNKIALLEDKHVAAHHPRRNAVRAEAGQPAPTGGPIIANSYGILLDDDGAFGAVDVELRRTVCRCLKHDPRERPGLEELLDQALKATGMRLRGDTEQQVRDWVQTYIYDASSQSTIITNCFEAALLKALFYPCCNQPNSQSFARKNGMPYLRVEAPPHIPDDETIESLLGQKYSDHNKRVRKTKTFKELSEEERARKNLVQLGTWTERIQGDPYGFWSSWAGNISHPRDERMYDILGPIFDELNATAFAENDDLTRLASFLSKVTTTDALALAEEFADDRQYAIVRDTPEELVVVFSIDKRTCRLMWAKDIDKNDDKSYAKAKRAKASAERTRQLFTEPTMSAMEQQYLMARLRIEKRLELPRTPLLPLSRDPQSDTSTNSQDRQTLKLLTTLRNMAREHFWLHMNAAQREAMRDIVKKGEIDPEFEPGLGIIKTNWQKRWNNGMRDPDYYRNYLVDTLAAESVWEMVNEDIVLVTDKNRQLIFVHFEKLVQTLYGEPTDKKQSVHVEDRLIRAIDLFSFFVGIPKPESVRHVVDSYIRDIHRELEPSLATVDRLPNAKMCVGHYGCWAFKGDPHGRKIRRTADTRNARATARNDVAYDLPLQFYKAVFGKASDVFRFLMQKLDPEYYAHCVEIFEQLPDNDVKVRTREEGEEKEKDFCSMFALGINGHTQRHMDQGDIKGGLAGLLTVGNYSGGNLCLPQLNLKLPYRSGSVALIRGSGLEHLVTDFAGPRFFIVGTNHETARKYALRKLGRLPPLPPRGKWDERDATARAAYPGEHEWPEDDDDWQPCVHSGADDDDQDEMDWDDLELHGYRALRSESSGSASTP
ncbi:hypothetical protein PG997_005680 [Apiospora hydei]|uniref:Protein kinase domain-containing protein n=1 Tax=Apiospora hydei TaxID=1337664 RepID=A0ABR1WQP6_9PEZI